MDENRLLILFIAVSTGEMVDEGNVDKQVQLDPQLMVMLIEDQRCADIYPRTDILRISAVSYGYG